MPDSGMEDHEDMIKVIDARGLMCPQPTLIMMSEAKKLQEGDIIELVADCSTFEADVRRYCELWKKSLLWIKVEGKAKRCQVRH